MVYNSDFFVATAITFSIATVLAGSIWITHKYLGNISSYPLSGAFFTEISDYPALTIFIHKTVLNGKNPIPISSPEGIKDGYYFITSFDREGRDYLGQVPPEIFQKMYQKGYDISLYSPQQLVDIYKNLHSATNTFFTNKQFIPDEKYFQEQIDFAKKQLANL